jgi:hypothetical protein
MPADAHRVLLVSLRRSPATARTESRAFVTDVARQLLQFRQQLGDAS